MLALPYVIEYKWKIYATEPTILFGCYDNFQILNNRSYFY